MQKSVPQGLGNMVFCRRGAVNEWYVNGPLGLQLSFTIAETPQAGTHRALKVVMAFDGAVAVKDMVIISRQPLLVYRMGFLGEQLIR